MLWSLLGLFLMGIGFPKCWLTERKWPRPAKHHVYDPSRGWIHNCKDDFTDDIDRDGDKEWWVKFIGFWLLIFIALSVVFGVLAAIGAQ